MRGINKILGVILYGTGKIISMILDALVDLIENMVVLVGGIFKGCFILMSMGGCLFFLLFANLGLRLLGDPIALSIILFSITFLIYGGRLVAYLKYLKYITAEYLFNTANYLMNGGIYQYKKFNDYKVAYRKAEEERIREQQRRYYEQQRQWEERTRQQWQQNFQGGQSSYGGQGYVNLASDFKKKYERSCDLLGVAYDASKQEVKSAYRKKAKEYHPDLNKLPNATRIFQEISAAYEFLSEDNIQRYISIK